MNGRTKMIIITSNEDFIKKLSLNKTTDTSIIDLDNNKQVASIGNNDNNFINLVYLAQLSELNSKNDHVYKRALHSPHHQQHRFKQLKPSKKKTDLICTICGDHAIGFNYDALSCSSCKAFFRRNTNQPLEKLRCLSGQGQCSVAHETHRKCARCRLDRCFFVGMRKDFILSEEEKQERKKRLEENRNLTSKHASTLELINSSQVELNSESFSKSLDEINCLLMDINEEHDPMSHEENVSLEILSSEDWIAIESIRSSFLAIFEDGGLHCFSLDLTDRVSALISWSQMASDGSLRLINFFRQIDEFENLNSDDRFILVKYNLYSLFPLFKCITYKPETSICSSNNNDAAVKHRQFFMLCGDPDGIRELFVNLIRLLVDATDQDATLLSLLVVTLIFSRGLSMNEDEPLLKDSLAVHRAHFHYVELLWNYFLYKWGEIEAYRHFLEILDIIFKIQSRTKRSRDFFREQFLTSNTVDRMAPLMQTVLHIS